MSKIIKFEDSVTLEGIPLLKDAQDFVNDVLKTSRQVSLMVETNATYSGYLLNRRTYPGRHMERATSTWTDAAHGGIAPYCAPVLTHHNEKSEPIGRVVSARYAKIWGPEAWDDDWKRPATNYDKGSGYIRLGLSITSPDAIAKFLDKRYLTFSTGMDGAAVICSVCGSDWMKGDGCKHKPGQVYEDPSNDKDSLECYWIVPPSRYKEVSVVNDPAQPHAVADTMKIVEDCAGASTLSDENLPAIRSLTNLSMDDVTLILKDDATGMITRLTKKNGQPDTIPNGFGSIRPSVKVSIPDLSELRTETTEKVGDGKVEEGVKPEKQANDQIGTTETGQASSTEANTSTKENSAMAENTPASGSAPAGGQNPQEVTASAVAALMEQLAELRATVKQLTTERDAKDADVKKLLQDTAALNSTLHKERCLRLAVVRAFTARKAGDVQLDSMGAVADYAKTLESRAVNSIEDSLKDADDLVTQRLSLVKGVAAFVTDTPRQEPSTLTHKAEDAKKDTGESSGDKLDL